MRDVDRIEAINREQLATATDRLLLRGRVARQRLARGSQVQIAVAAPLDPAPRAEGSQPGIGIPARPFGSRHQPRAEGSQPRIDMSPSRAAGSLRWIEVPSPRGSSVHPRIIIAPSLAHPRPPRRPLLPLQLFTRR